MSVPLKARLLLADDHAMVRRGLRLILDAEPDLEVVAEAGDGVEAVEQALRHEVHLAVLDVSMPRLTGLQAAREIVRQRPDLRIERGAPAIDGDVLAGPRVGLTVALDQPWRFVVATSRFLSRGPWAGTTNRRRRTRQ